MSFFEQLKKNRTVIYYSLGFLLLLFLFSRVQCSSGDGKAPSGGAFNKTLSEIPVPKDTSSLPVHELKHAIIESNEWRKLASLTYKNQEIDGQPWHIPVFSDEIKAMEGSTIELKGYLIPLQAGKFQQHFMLSVLPFDNCYYCGKGSGIPEMVEVEMNSPINYTNQPIIVRGIFQLNELDEEHFALRLVGGEFVESK